MITPTPSSAPSGRDQSILFSPFGVGKTTMAVTASAHCPAWISATVAPPPADAPLTDIPDLAWLAYDRNALAGFASLRLNVPLLFDLSTVAPGRIVEETLEILAWLKGQSQVTGAVLDTLTAFDTSLGIRHAAKAASNKMAYYDAILGDHMRVYAALRQLNLEVQLLAHTKAAFDADDAAKAKRVALDVPDYTAHITGQAGARYKADCDNILFLQRESAVVNGKKQTRVIARTQPGGGIECKVRGGVVLPDKLDADWRVIRAAMGRAPLTAV